MRADYATSDLINKVNSDWISEVLINPELDRPDPGHDVVVGELPRQSSRKQAPPVRRDPVPPAANADAYHCLASGGRRRDGSSCSAER